jgi:hypothetical protein
MGTLGATVNMVSINLPSDLAFQLIGATTGLGELAYPSDVGPPPGVGTPLNLPLTPPVPLQGLTWFSFRFLPKTAGTHTAAFSFNQSDGTGYSITLTGVAVAGQCFIATATFGTPMHPSVVMLREYRDEVLLKSRHAAWFERILFRYYVISPPIARGMNRSRLMKGLIGYTTVLPIVFLLKSSPRLLRKEDKQRVG